MDHASRVSSMPKTAGEYSLWRRVARGNVDHIIDVKHGAIEYPDITDGLAGTRSERDRGAVRD